MPTPKLPYNVCMGLELFKTLPNYAEFKNWAQAVNITENVTGPYPNDRNCLHWSFTVTEPVLNHVGTMHGGMVFYFLDIFTSLHLFGIIGPVQHVSLRMSGTFMKAIPKGQKVVLKTYVPKFGKSIAFLEAVIVDAENPKVTYVKATHMKMILSRMKFDIPPNSMKKLANGNSKL